MFEDLSGDIGSKAFGKFKKKEDELSGFPVSSCGREDGKIM